MKNIIYIESEIRVVVVGGDGGVYGAAAYAVTIIIVFHTHTYVKILLLYYRHIFISFS